MTPRRERKFEANISRGVPSAWNRTCGNGDSCFGFRVNSFSVAFLVAMVLSGGWCSLWTSRCYGIVSASPIHRTYDLSRPHISDSFLRTQNNFRDFTSNSKPNNLEDSPEYSANNYLSSRSSVLLKRSRRISRTSQTTLPGNSTNRDTRNPRRGHSYVGGFSRTSKSFSKSLKSSRVQVCSHVGDMTNDISARAYLAGTIFEGKARSRSSVKNPGGLYFVTFQVQHVHKDQNAGTLRIRSQVRLQFREKINSVVSNRCIQDYNYTSKSLEPVRANIKRGGKYLVFVSGIGPHNFSVLGEPVFRTKKNLQAVRDVLCHNCVRPVGVWGLRDVTVKVKDKLRLVCRCKGNPLPAIHWLKDGVLINATRNSRIQYKKKRSSLLIPRVRPEDAGRYECRAISVMGESTASWATVTVTPMKSNTLTDNTTTLWPLFGGPCPIDTYCLNGGTCTYYETVGELVCQCAEGYKGQRCESKDVYNRSSMYRPMSYFCKLGISSSYYC